MVAPVRLHYDTTHQHILNGSISEKFQMLNVIMPYLGFQGLMSCNLVCVYQCFDPSNFYPEDGSNMRYSGTQVNIPDGSASIKYNQ
jgi:hypothetical protein